MQTRYWQVDPNNPETDIIRKAARLLIEGELVAFPTETVYGLGALASISHAVEKIFAAKERPANKPLLVHVSDREQARNLVGEPSADAILLMESFWPGPLSIILPAGPLIPDIVRGGKAGVGLRMPAHPVALALIAEAGPIAAPSANLSGRPSPLTANHVRQDLDGRIAAVLDAGPTGLGIESTVIDLSTPEYVVLRPGGIPIEALENILQRRLTTIKPENDIFPHYRTTSTVILCQDRQQFLEELRRPESGTAVVIYPDHQTADSGEKIQVFILDLEGDRSNLYSILREAEAQGVKRLVFAPLPQVSGGKMNAIIDRVKKAAHNNHPL